MVEQFKILWAKAVEQGGCDLLWKVIDKTPGFWSLFKALVSRISVLAGEACDSSRVVNDK